MLVNRTRIVLIICVVPLTSWQGMRIIFRSHSIWMSQMSHSRAPFSAGDSKAGLQASHATVNRGLWLIVSGHKHEINSCTWLQCIQSARQKSGLQQAMHQCTGVDDSPLSWARSMKLQACTWVQVASSVTNSDLLLSFIVL